MLRFAGGKRSAETFILGVDFSPWLASGETLISAECQVSTAGEDEIVADASMTVVGTQLLARIAGGESNQGYPVVFQVVTSAGNTYEQVILVVVSDDTANRWISRI